ncbi:hypothetical protein CSC18_2244 [Klebsiella aerogenes]|nr:hypothetical protein CSC18_2244 [Klebsiella aerogenes]
MRKSFADNYLYHVVLKIKKPPASGKKTRRFFVGATDFVSNFSTAFVADWKTCHSQLFL